MSLSTSNNTTSTTDLWIKVLSATDSSDADKGQLVPLVGPAYKVDVVIEVVKTRALVDNGSQVSLVRRELLPKIKECNNWTLEQRHRKNRPLKVQPVEASGQELGVESLVAFEMMMEQTRQKVIIPCFVMTSAKPIWQGTVANCAMALGSNALVQLGIQLVQSDGSIVSPTLSDSTETITAAAAQGVVLAAATYLAPGQTRHVELITGQAVGPGDRYTCGGQVIITGIEMKEPNSIEITRVCFLVMFSWPREDVVVQVS